MENKMNANNSIQCTVSSCAYHNDAKSVCSLSAITTECVRRKVSLGA